MQHYEPLLLQALEKLAICLCRMKITPFSTRAQTAQCPVGRDQLDAPRIGHSSSNQSTHSTSIPGSAANGCFFLNTGNFIWCPCQWSTCIHYANAVMPCVAWPSHQFYLPCLQAGNPFHVGSCPTRPILGLT